MSQAVSAPDDTYERKGIINMDMEVDMVALFWGFIGCIVISGLIGWSSHNQ